jgi:hypothetical protein
MSKLSFVESEYLRAIIVSGQKNLKVSKVIPSWIINAYPIQSQLSSLFVLWYTVENDKVENTQIKVCMILMSVSFVFIFGLLLKWLLVSSLDLMPPTIKKGKVLDDEVLQIENISIIKSFSLVDSFILFFFLDL